MANANDELGKLASRISRLEHQNRWLKLGALSIAAIAAFAVMVGAGPNKESKTVEAEGFIVRDANGVARVEIDKNGFFINNEEGKHRISIFATKEGGTGIFLFADDTYKRQVGMGIQDKHNFCGFNVNDDKGVSRVSITTAKNKPKIELQDETGKPFFSQAQP